MFLIFLFCLVFSFVSAYKPVVIIHGLLDGPSQMETLVQFIKSTHNGTNVTLIDLYDGYASLRALPLQANIALPTLCNIMKEHPEGIHVIGYSQGALLARGLIEYIPDHNVINFISLSGPQGGQYGDTRVFKYLFPLYLKRSLYRIFYTTYGQGISVANYWNDPHHHDLYLNYSTWLAVVNNERPTHYGQQFKASFTRLKNVALIGGPSDKVITPWQSSQFAAYNETDQVVPMEEQEWYRSDLFGLRTVASRGGLHTYTVDGVPHTHWHRNITVYHTCIEPWLT